MSNNNMPPTASAFIRLVELAARPIATEIDVAISGLAGIGQLNFHLYREDVASPEYQCNATLKLLSRIDREINFNLRHRERQQIAQTDFYRVCRAIVVPIIEDAVTDRLARKHQLLRDEIAQHL